MKTWSQSWRDGLLSGSLASVVSTVVLTLRGQYDTGSPYAPTNVISHWFHGERAVRKDAFSTRYTAVGYGIHHAASVLWATIYEKLFGELAERDGSLSAIKGATTIAALSCFADYKLTPHRLQPGYEKRLSTASVAMVYASVAVALAASSMVARTRRAVDEMDGHARESVALRQSGVTSTRGFEP